MLHRKDNLYDPYPLVCALFPLRPHNRPRAQVTLTWDHTPTAAQPDVATSFQVLGCQGVGCTPVDLPGAVTAGAVKTYVHTGIAANAIYCYEVVALNGPTRSAPSNKACGGLFAPPAPPSSLTLTFTQ